MVPGLRHWDRVLGYLGSVPPYVSDCPNDFRHIASPFCIYAKCHLPHRCKAFTSRKTIHKKSGDNIQKQILSTLAHNTCSTW